VSEKWVWGVRLETNETNLNLLCSFLLFWNLGWPCTTSTIVTRAAERLGVRAGKGR
jgi:hypothetical protein